MEWRAREASRLSMACYGLLFPGREGSIPRGNKIGGTTVIAYDQIFTDAQIYLDGSSFYRCKFHRCTIVINGFMGCNLVDPQFVDCRWTVAGPAQTTFELLAAL